MGKQAGRSKCKHKRQRYNCRKCSKKYKSVFCKHGLSRYYCQKCDGRYLCEHGKRKYYCRLCKGSRTCEHSSNVLNCPKCTPKGRNKSNEPLVIVIDDSEDESDMHLPFKKRK